MQGSKKVRTFAVSKGNDNNIVQHIKRHTTMAAKKVQILAFYKVNNPLGFDGHSFDDMDDESAYKKLLRLAGETLDGLNFYVYFYSVEDLTDFQLDFNDENCELCDGSNWWCKLLTISK